MQTFLKSTLPLLLILLSIFTTKAQTEKQTTGKNVEIGLETQVYPTGIIPGIRLEKYLNSSSSINLRLGYQIIDHRDLGVQDNETGSGYGGSIAYRAFLGPDQRGLSLAVRTDLWINQMDWETDSNSGTTTITVIQPTLMGEYAFRLANDFSITPSLSAGWEWNVHTDGEPTGEGPIILVGCTFSMGL
ncbi:MAG: hypothetical protein AAGA77_07775 [Bacteroidota bacterium]